MQKEMLKKNPKEKQKEITKKNPKEIPKETQNELHDAILLGTLDVFREKGLKFTMDDIAKHMGISKKTIYKVFADKEKLFLDMVDYLFDSVKKSEAEVMCDMRLTTLEKIRKILGVLPEGYKELDFGKLYELKEKYPSTYRRVEERLETGWENTMELLERGIEEGVIRPVPLCMVKMMLEAALEQFFQRDVLIVNHLSYAEALDAVVDILVSGIAVRE